MKCVNSSREVNKEKPLSEKVFSVFSSMIIAIAALCVFFGGIVIFTVFGSWSFSTTLDESRIGQFGDFIGGVVGTLLAFVASILYYVALREQGKDSKINKKNLELQTEILTQQIEEFEAQREELKETRKVYEKQTKLFETQTKLSQTQTDISRRELFVSNFYSMLSVFTDLQYNLNRNNIFDNVYQKMLLKAKDINDCKIEDLISIYEKVYQDNVGTLSKYFKTIFHILNYFVKDNASLKRYAGRYVKLFRSQLSDKELIIMYYNYFSIYGINARKLVLEKKLLKHINILDKIEMQCINHPLNYEIKSFLDQVSIIFQTVLTKFTSLDEIADISVSEQICFLSNDITCSITNTDNTLDILLENFLDKELTLDEFAKIVHNKTYDVLYLNNFLIPKYENIVLHYHKHGNTCKVKITITF